MLLKAPAGRGAPSIGGQEIAANAQGYYEVDDYSQAVNLIEAFGYEPVDPATTTTATTAPAAANDQSELRTAAITALKALGLTVPDDADDALVAEALVGATSQDHAAQ